jgi:6-phosphogluconolactonase
MFVYVGAYTESPAGSADGISVYRFDPQTGALSVIQVAPGSPNPSFVALSPDRRHLYVVSELDVGGVRSFVRNPVTGELSALNHQPSHGSSPCYISVDPTGRYALVANYGDGVVTALPIAADGHVQPATSVVQQEGSSVVAGRQDGPHAHMIRVTPDGRYVLATDLGADRIFVYRLDLESGLLESNDAGPASAASSPGTGPRHFAFAPDGRSLYAINELASSLTAWAWDAEWGSLSQIETVSMLPEGFAGDNSGAEVVVSPDGRFVYASNRGHDSIAIFAAGGDGLTLVGHEPTQGKSPRGFNLDPTGSWLLVANQRSDSIVIFRRDTDTGLLSATDQVVHSPTPVAIVFARE